MKSNFNFFNNAFLKISGIKKIDLSNYIVIKNSKNVKISDNYINNSITYFLTDLPQKAIIVIHKQRLILNLNLP